MPRTLAAWLCMACCMGTAQATEATEKTIASGTNKVAEQLKSVIEGNTDDTKEIMVTSNPNSPQKAKVTEIQRRDPMRDRDYNKKLLPTLKRLQPESSASPLAMSPTSSARLAAETSDASASKSSQPVNANNPTASTATKTPLSSRQAIEQHYQSTRAKALGLASSSKSAKSMEPIAPKRTWRYAGENGPENWSKLDPEFQLCAEGKRQAPINIETGQTLLGPTEALLIQHQPSTGFVVNTGNLLKVDVEGDNAITVRSSIYRLTEIRFHTPSGMQIDGRTTAMAAHLIHRNLQGQLAIVVVMLEPGEPNMAIERIWTYLPLETQDKTRMPSDWLNLNDLLPADKKYYEFMGSLDTPPCTEGVLWIVLKTPQTLSATQLRLFKRLFENNTRPPQPTHGRLIRETQP